MCLRCVWPWGLRGNVKEDNVFPSAFDGGREKLQIPRCARDDKKERVECKLRAATLLCHQQPPSPFNYPPLFVIPSTARDLQFLLRLESKFVFDR